MIAEKLLGTWRLVVSQSVLEDGSVIYPMGQDLQGLISYTHDGFVQVNLMRPGGPRVENVQLSVAKPDDPALSAIARGYLAYAGRYRIDEERSIVHHDFELCLDPNLLGTPQHREVEFIGDDLQLSAIANTDGKPRRSSLLWRRP